MFSHIDKLFADAKAATPKPLAKVKVLVEEGMDEIIRLVIEYRRSLNRFGR